MDGDHGFALQLRADGERMLGSHVAEALSDEWNGSITTMLQDEWARQAFIDFDVTVLRSVEWAVCIPPPGFALSEHSEDEGDVDIGEFFCTLATGNGAGCKARFFTSHVLLTTRG